MPDTKASKGRFSKSEEAELIPILVSISKSTRALTGLKLAEIGFHNGQDEFLLALKDESPSSVTDIADKITVRPSTVSKMIDRLAKGGLVERVAGNIDGRVTMVKITHEGIRACDELTAKRKELEEEITSLHPDTKISIEALKAVSVALKGRLNRLR